MHLKVLAMKLNRLGNYIELVNKRNSDEKLNKNDILGISTQKRFIETKANLRNVSTKNYKIVDQNEFAYVADTSRRGDKISLAYNDLNKKILVSSITTVFKVRDHNKLLPEFLYIYFNRPEFDRIARYNSWGSAREAFSWDDFCDLKIHIPDIDIQQKYVNVYLSLKNNSDIYQKGFEDLKMVSDGFIDGLKGKYKSERIGKYITERREKNINGEIKVARGVSSVEKAFIMPRRNINPKTIHNYNVVHPKDLAYRPIVTGYNDSLCIAISSEKEKVVISPIYPVFFVSDSSKLLPEYLFMWLSKDSFDKYAWFHSTGSARETLNFDILSDYEIPIPPIEVQESIINIYELYEQRTRIYDEIELLANEICPILIKGAVEESKGVI